MRRILLALCLVLAGASGGRAQSPTVSAVLSSATCPGTGCVTLGVNGVGAVGLQVTGTFSGTISFEASIDGLNYQALNLTPINSTTAATSTTGTGIWTGYAGGLAVVRARMSSYASGTATVTLQAAPNF